MLEITIIFYCRSKNKMVSIFPNLVKLDRYDTGVIKRLLNNERIKSYKRLNLDKLLFIGNDNINVCIDATPPPQAECDI